MDGQPIRDYRDLLVWQKAMELALICETVCNEGNGRFSRADYLRHLSIANGSLRELESHLHFGVRAFGETEASQEALRLTTLVCKLLAGLARSLRGKKKAG